MKTITGVLCLLLMTGSGAPAQAPLSTRELKAAIIIRLIDFVEWPAVKAGESFRICVIADRALADAMTGPAKSISVKGAPVTVQYQAGLPPSQGEPACQVMLIGAYDEGKVRTFLERNAASPMLTVGETDEFLSAGGVLRMLVEGGRVRLQLNLAAVEKTRLVMSSRLMRLASVIDNRSPNKRRSIE